MAQPDAATLRADPKAAAQLPADNPGAHEHLHATPKYSGFGRLRAGRAAAANPPASHPAVDGAGPPTAADLPAAGPTAAAVPPANVSGIDEHVHADVQHPALLRPGGDAASPGGHPRNPAGRDTGPSKEDSEEKLRAIFLLATDVHELLQGRGLIQPRLCLCLLSFREHHLAEARFPRMSPLGSSVNRGN